MKVRKRVLHRIMVDCLWQAPVSSLLPSVNPLLGSLPRSGWVFSALAINRIGDGEENGGHETKDKGTCSIPSRSFSQRELEDTRCLEAPSSHRTPFAAKDDKSSLKDLSQNSFTQTNSLHAAFKENGIPVPILEEAHRGKGTGFSADLMGQVLRAVANDWELGLRVFLWVGQQPGYRHTSDTLDLMVLMLGRAQQFQILWQLLEEMKKQAHLIRLKTFEVIIRSYVKVGKVEDAVVAFENMKNFDCPIDTRAFNTLVRVLCYEKRVQDCQLIFERLKCTYPPDEKTYSILIHGWCEANRLTEALGILEEMMEEGFHPTLGAYTCLIEALCTKNMMEVANKLFNHMKNNILYKLSETKVSTKGSENSFLLKEISPTLDCVAYNSLITSLCTLGELDDACELLERMVNLGFTPYSKTYSNVFTLLCKRRKAKEAFQLYNKVTEASFSPSPQIHDNLIEMFCCTGHVGMAFEIWNKVHEKGYSCRRESYNVLIHGLCYNGLFKEAFEHFRTMIQKGIVPLYQTYRMLHFGLLKDGDLKRFDELKEVIKQLEDQGIWLASRRK
eukprot:Gb_39082 [translate_table: standard]